MNPPDDFILARYHWQRRPQAREAYIRSVHLHRPEAREWLRERVLPALQSVHGLVGECSTIPDQRWVWLRADHREKHPHRYRTHEDTTVRTNAIFDASAGRAQLLLPPRLHHASREGESAPRQGSVTFFMSAEQRRRMQADLRTVEALLLEWGMSFHLADDWILDQALRTVNAWARGENVAWVNPLRDWAIRGDTLKQPLHIPVSRWDPRRESLKDAHARMLEECRNFLRQYLEEAWRYEGSGSQLPASDDGLMKTNLEHFEWLVRWQVNGWTYSEIAKHYFVEVGTVKTELKRTAEVVGIRRRRGAPGRPAKRSLS